MLSQVDVTGAIPENWNAEKLRREFERRSSSMSTMCCFGIFDARFGDIGDVFVPRERYSDRPFA